MTLRFFIRSPRTAASLAIAGLCLLGGGVSCAASPVLTRDEARAAVLANGFLLVLRAEPLAARPDPAAWESAAAAPRWDVWAVKDGIAYRVTVDGGTGDLVGAAPAVEDD